MLIYAVGSYLWLSEYDQSSVGVILNVKPAIKIRTVTYWSHRWKMLIDCLDETASALHGGAAHRSKWYFISPLPKYLSLPAILYLTCQSVCH